MKKRIYQIIVLIVSLAVALEGHHKVEAAPQSVPTRPRVYAYYYLWWSRRHWQDQLGSAYPMTVSPLPLPASTDTNGCAAASRYAGNHLIDVPAQLYGQDDPGVIERDIRSAKSAGLTGFWLNWKGNGTLTQTLTSNTYTPRLAEAFSASNRVGGFMNWVSYETYSMPSADFIINDLNYLYAQFGSSPAWEKIDGQPVVTFTGSRKYSTADLTAISAAVRDKFYFVGDESQSSLTDARLALFDGMTYYWSSQDPYGNPASFNQIKAIGDKIHAAGKRWFAPFAPGFDSVLLSGGSTCVPRRNGDTMRALWKGNSASNPDGWGLISWNEIGENSHVQPMQKWGSTYLNVLSELINYDSSQSTVFQDVPNSHVYWHEIETIYVHGITAGCSISPRLFCPSTYLDRAQIAVFNLKANFGSGYSPPSLQHLFADDWSRAPYFEAWAESMYNTGLSAGCSNNPVLLYCPWQLATREQAAIFGLRMKYGTSYSPPRATGTIFVDIPNVNYWSAGWVEKAYADGLMPNCGIDPSSGKPLFCPGILVDRGLA
ncbi:MAG TPA: endo-1,3-alpha-glucanase family glycosylhydrolase, partial [Anaerolineales bacterium]|nr:endo-1,3-alpha-glucanase family glycosylhydrolase [Anaerolineales bacterium]